MPTQATSQKTAREYFTQRLGQSYDPRLKRLQGTYRFEIRGVGSWRLTVNSGNLTLEEGDLPADCIIRWDESDLADIATGRLNFITAFLQGRTEIEGEKKRAAGLIPYFKEIQRRVA